MLQFKMVMILTHIEGYKNILRSCLLTWFQTVDFDFRHVNAGFHFKLNWGGGYS